MAPEIKSAQVNLRFAPSLKAAAEQAAAREHRSLNSLIEKLLTEHLNNQPTLEDWHDRAQARLVALLSEWQLLAAMQMGLAAKSYCISGAARQGLAPHTLITHLRSAHSKLSGMFPYMPFFYPYTRPGLTPYFASDRNLRRGATEEILESFNYPDAVSTIELWRVSPAGLASDIRPLFEDSGEFPNFNLESGKWFSPFFMTRDLAAVVLHALDLAERVPGAEVIEFRCEWSGLLERELADADPGRRWSRGKIARVDQRITQGEWPVEVIRSEWPQVVSALGGPVVRLFDSAFDYSADWVRSQSSRFQG
jgi:hypothetical protein